jgi:hypothetical protein
MKRLAFGSRCADTVRPYALAAELPMVAEPVFTEAGFGEAPDLAFEQAGLLLADTWDTGAPTVLCGHRPYLPALVDHLIGCTPPAEDADPWQLPLPETVHTASLTVLHLHLPDPADKPVTLAVEHQPR